MSNNNTPPPKDTLSTQNARTSPRSPSPSPASTEAEKAKKKYERMSSMGKLTQEIEDEFLTCKICLDSYSSPKSLNCLHTFCERCIEGHAMSECTYKKYSDYREFTCPLCRKRTQLPIGGVKKLPDNFLVMNLIETVTRQKPSKYPYCDFCKLVDKKHKEANSKCLDCNKLLCKDCVEVHRDTKVTRNHDIFDVQIEKDIECKEHPEEVVRYYCEECETCVCVLCTFNEHKDHEVTQFADAVVKYKDHIQSLVSECRKKIDTFDDQMVTLNSCESIIKEAEKAIHDTAMKCISDIRSREKVLVEELQNIYGKDAMEYIGNKGDVSVMVDSLRSTCNLTEVILQGKDIELLLLKKDVEDKLNTLHDVNINNLPTTITKEVTFVAGSVDLGYLQDKDRPLLSKFRAKRPLGGSMEPEDFPTHEDKDAQTDKKENAEACTGTGHSADISETSIQTEEQEESSNSDSEDSDVETEDKSTATEEVETEEKAVNTRSSIQSFSRQSPDRDDTAAGNGYRERRRRRRERHDQTSFDSGEYSPTQQYSYPLPANPTIGYSTALGQATSQPSSPQYAGSNPTSPSYRGSMVYPGPRSSEGNYQQSYWERRRNRRQAGRSLDAGDEFYDAKS